jgi:hypothetical protein
MRCGEFYELRLRKAMSVMEAKDALGFKSSATPTKDEIARAYKNLAFKHHPDRGGDPAKMVELNVAKDVLEGKQRPSTPSGPAVYQPPAREKPAPPPPDHVSFAKAMRDAKVPSGVDWKFATVPGGDYTAHKGDLTGLVIYGKKKNTHVFVSILHYFNQGNAFEPLDINKFSMYVHEQTDYGDLATVGPKVIRELWRGFPARIKGYSAKVQLLPDGYKFTSAENGVGGRSLSFKDALTQMGEKVPDRWKGKINITMELGDEIKGLGSPYGITLVVNGKEYKLSARAAEMASKARLYKLVFGDYFYNDSRKAISKMRGAKKKKILGLLHEICNKANERTPLIDALKAAYDAAK